MGIWGEKEAASWGCRLGKGGKDGVQGRCGWHWPAGDELLPRRPKGRWRKVRRNGFAGFLQGKLVREKRSFRNPAEGKWLEAGRHPEKEQQVVWRDRGEVEGQEFVVGLTCPCCDFSWLSSSIQGTGVEKAKEAAEVRFTGCQRKKE